MVLNVCICQLGNQYIKDLEVKILNVHAAIKLAQKLVHTIKTSTNLS